MDAILSTPLPFAIAIGAGGALVVLYFLGALLGGFDIDLIDVPSADGGVLAWIGIGRMPLVAILALLLLTFGLSGGFLHVATGLPSLILAAPAAVAAFFATHWLAGILGKVLPKDEGHLLSRNDFLGGIATVIQGPLNDGLPGMVRYVDRAGDVHDIRATPSDPAVVIPVRSEVVLVEYAPDRPSVVRVAPLGI